MTSELMDTTMERRRFRRAELNIPVSIRSLAQHDSANLVVGQAQDVSLAGVYCYVKGPCPLKPEEPVVCSVVIPEDQQRAFPFVRLHGKGWILRVGAVTRGRRAGESQTSEPLVGVAVAFAPDVTALGAIGS